MSVSPSVSVKLLHRAIPLKNLSSSHLVLAPTNKEMISRLRAQIFNIYLELNIVYVTALGRQEDHCKFKASLIYIVRPHVVV